MRRFLRFSEKTSMAWVSAYSVASDFISLMTAGDRSRLRPSSMASAW